MKYFFIVIISLSLAVLNTVCAFVDTETMHRIGWITSGAATLIFIVSLFSMRLWRNKILFATTVLTIGALLVGMFAFHLQFIYALIFSGTAIIIMTMIHILIRNTANNSWFL